MKKLLILLVVILLVGCGHPFCHPQRPYYQIRDDHRECDYQAELSTGSMATGAYRGLNIGTIIGKCMKMRGYGTHLPFSKTCHNYRNDN
jgi:hypothetical protein